VNGQTKVLTLSPDKKSGAYTSEAEFSLAGAEVHYQLSAMLLAEREAKRPKLVATITIDTLDFAIAPPADKAAAGKKP
jgi:hypothetical protein